MCTASYVISGTGIRYKKDDGRHEILWLDKSDKRTRGGLNPRIIQERAEKVFQLMPERMNHLIIVNGNLSDFETTQACVKVAEKYADNVMVIPPLLSRMMYAIADIAKKHNPFKDVTILVVTVNRAFIDFVILQRNKSFELNIVHRELHKQDRRICTKEFSRIYDYYYPHATVILVQDDFFQYADDINVEFNPRNFYIRHHKRWDYLLMYGALLRAEDGDNEYDQRYQIPNFSMGIEAVFRGYGARSTVVLQEHTKLPCKIYGFNGAPHSTTLFYFPEHYYISDNLTYERKEASREAVWITGKSNQIIGYYDERGVPYLTEKTEQKEEIDADKNEPEIASISSEETSTSLRFCEPIQITKQPAEPSSITFKFEDKHCAVEIYQNKMTQKIRDSAGNEWTPLYLSMANGIPEIGRKAKNDYQAFPKYVIYDVLKIIGKPLSEIKIDPKWGFKLVETDGTVLFQIETPSGPRLIPQEIVISAFLKAMKLRVESFWGAENQIIEFHLSTDFRLSKAQKVIFEKAAEKNALKISSYIVTDSFE